MAARAMTWAGAVLATVLVVPSCSSGDVVQDPAAPRPTTAGTREPPSSDPSASWTPDLGQLCALVTGEELEAIVGTPVTDGVIQDSGWEAPECRFETVDGVAGNGSVSVMVAPGVIDGVEVSPTPLVSGFRVGGLEADWHQVTGLVVVVDDEQPRWLLHTVVRLAHRNDRARSVELAELLVSRLPLLRAGRSACSLFGPDDFEDVFGVRTNEHPPAVLTAPVVLGECVFFSTDRSSSLELGGYVADLPGPGWLDPVEPLSRRVTSLGPDAYWHRRSGVSLDLGGQGLVWVRVAAMRSAQRPDRDLSIAAARIVLERLERLDRPAGPRG